MKPAQLRKFRVVKSRGFLVNGSPAAEQHKLRSIFTRFYDNQCIHLQVPEFRLCRRMYQFDCRGPYASTILQNPTLNSDSTSSRQIISPFFNAHLKFKSKKKWLEIFHRIIQFIWPVFVFRLVIKLTAKVATGQCPRPNTLNKRCNHQLFYQNNK